MLKAEQTAIINQANVHMASLRGSEILYFSQFFTSFGTQATLISVLVIGNIQQVPGLESENHVLWIHFFWITSALAFCSSIYVFICCSFISVYGQGLALRGPTGSMVKAVELMVIEQNSIVTYFGITLFFLGLHLIGTCGIMMNSTFAVICSLIVIGGMFTWYTICSRVYNRFQFTAAEEDWDNENDDDSYDAYDDGDYDGDDDSNRMTYKFLNKSRTSRASRMNNNNSNKSNNSNNNSKNNNKSSNNNNNNNNNNRNNNSHNIKNNQDHHHHHHHSGIDTNVCMEGYMKIVDYSSTNSNNNYTSNTTTTTTNRKWPRRYFVLKNQHLYYYPHHDAYQYQSESPINKRPISFTGYFIDTEIVSENPITQQMSENQNKTVSENKIFTLILTPNLQDVDYVKVWEFQCESLEELYQWKVALIESFSLSNTFHYNRNDNNHHHQKNTKNDDDDDGLHENNHHHRHSILNENPITAVSDIAESVLMTGVNSVTSVGNVIRRKSITVIKTTLIT